MAPARQCILCETVHASSQEMEEHMRSMLHHRELEKLKGRDCGHECRVCKVTVVSLTEYASHISSATHKQKVEASELKACGKDTDDYFDRALVEMIEKRKEQIRKDKEAAAAKEEERKRKEEFQQRLQQTKERYRLECGWQQSSRWYNGQHNNWMYQHNSRPGEQKPWHNNQGKSATWHAQEPPNFNQWAPDNYHGRWEDRRQDYGFANNQQCRLPWLSRGGSSYGVYGQNNISQYSHRGRGNSFNRQSRTLPPNTFNRPLNPFPNTANEQKGHQSESPQNVEGRTTEPDLKGNKGPKGFGSNPKLDKTCRWSPYPVTKDTASTEKNHNTTKAQNHNSTSENSASNRLSQSEQKLAPLPSSGLAVKESQKHKTKVEELKSRGESCTRSSSSSSRSSSSSSSSSSAQKEGHVTPTSASSSQNTAVLSKEKKIPSLPTLLSVAPLSKVLSPGDAQSKPVAKQSGLSSKAASFGSLKSRQQPQLPETLCKARLTSSEKRSSLDSSKNKKDVSQPIMEKQQMDVAQSQIGVNKENTCRQNTAPPYSPGSVRPERPLLLSSESSQFLQSLQVSTSTVECSDAAASNKKHEETRLKDNEKSSSTDPDESLQAAEEGYGSGREPCKGAEAQSISGSSSNLSKLDLPTVLKRDLTKHMSSKNKTGSHEPNLNIARRVRNLSESRRSDSEKESGLKPTVRQLISSSGSRRNVNWEQVYQEVRKKQDKGKGMPRFGIEMVPNEVEDQSQEEDDIPLLEGEHWEALLGISAPAPRKRSLSESSLVPESTSAIFTSLISKETSQRESLSPKQQKPSVISMDTSGSKDVHCQQLTERKTQREPEKLMAASVKPLQRSDSVLGDSSSGTEQFDGTGTGKRRRATVDAPSTDTSCLGHNSKRRKVKSKQERSHIDQLLAVSLREDELSRSLQTTDNSLIQARAALEAAYMEVQRLMVVKQQMTAEMSTLRNKRIELLKGMQGSLEEAPQVTVKEERMHTTDADSGIMFSPAMDMSAAEATPPAVATSHPPNPSPTASLHHPPSPSHSFTPIMIKQEPQSPVHATPELDPVEYKALCAHSTTPEVPVAPEVPGFTSKSSPKRSPDFYQTHTDHSWEKFEDPGDCKQSLSGLVESTEKASQTAGSCLMPMSDCKPLKPLSSSRLSSELDSVADCTASKFPEPLPVPSVFNLPAPPSDLTNGKRVRKLKKRKVLKKAQVPEQPESSDTEIDIEPLRRRWSRPRRRPSGGSQVTTSSVTVDETNMENGEEAQRQLSPANKHEEAEPPASAPPELTENLDSEENMEVTTDCRKSNTESHAPEPTSVKVKDFSRAELQNLACNEVTSTSDMDICKSSESDLPFPISMSRSLRSQSDASSDHGGDELATEGLFEGHQEAVNAMQIHSGLLYTCSGDRTVRAFDLVSHECVAVFEGHSSKVSCLLVSTAPSLHHRLYTGSSDQTVRCYSLKTQEFEHQFSLSDRVLCLHSRWRTLYVGLANGTVVTINLKTNKQMDVFECHGPRAVSCLASSQEGARRILLVGSYDNTISVRDAKNGLLLRTLEGHTKTVLCLKVINDLVFSGSSDHCVYTHNIHTGELLWVFKGHTHAVTVVTVLGKVMVTACLDKLVRVYDLQSQEQLQVYGGHKDMVMCMTVHKNMIYTGCYDGSVEAVKLNLMQNHRCWWHGCSLVYGVTEHLQQHLINDHGSANVQKLKCRWKKCEEVFSVRNGSKQRAMLLHMQKHAEETDLKP